MSDLEEQLERRIESIWFKLDLFWMFVCIIALFWIVGKLWLFYLLIMGGYLAKLLLWLFIRGRKS